MKNKFVVLALLTGLLAGFAFNVTGADVPDLKYGLYIHFGMPTFANPGEQGEIPANRFAPVSVNTKEWARIAKEAGMTFAVLTAKHESGFCLWDSLNYDYDVGSSPYKGDIIGDFISSCKAERILPGALYAIIDTHNGCTANSVVSDVYFNLIKKHVTELHTKYPGLRVQVFSGSSLLSSEQWNELVQLVNQLNPECVILDRNHDPKCQAVTINKGWMWRPGENPGIYNLLPLGPMLRQYWEAQAAGKSFLLNAGPDASGDIRPGPIVSLMEMKRLIALGPIAPVIPATSQSAEKTEEPLPLRIGAPDSQNWHMEFGPERRIWFTSRASLDSPEGTIRECVASTELPHDREMQHPLRTVCLVNDQPFPAERVGQRISARFAAVFPESHTNVVVSFAHEILFVGRHLKRGPVTNPTAPVDPEVLQWALKETKNLDFNSPAFTAWLGEQGLRPQPSETAITFARRACQFAHQHLTYIYPPKRDKLSVACRFTEGDCESYSQLFVGILRANGIPARDLIGHWVEANNGPVWHGDHARSEFYAAGIGWVPVDANNNEFGNENADFLVVGDQGEMDLHAIGGSETKTTKKVLCWISTLVDRLPLAGASPTPIQKTETAEPQPSAADRLKEIESLYQQGLISKDVYDQKRKEIIDSL